MIKEILEKSVEEQVTFLERYTVEKVRAEDLKMFADFMLEQMPETASAPGAIDLCGTGGSGLQRINTSTIAAFILAQLGVGVAKHGNNAASGRVGSFDLLEALNIDIHKNAEALRRDYERTGLAFIYARQFHPVMKNFVEARKAIGKPTIFNLLGPLLNPAKVKRQIIGTSFPDKMEMLAEACKLLGRERVMIVCGGDGLDEVTLTGKTKVVELKDGEIFKYEVSPADFGLDPCSFEEIAGGDLEENKEIALDILSGRCQSRHADLVFINVAMVLRLADKCDDLRKGYEIAKSVIGLRSLHKYSGNILEEIAASKLLPQSERDFKKALSCNGLSVIAEVKFASPSEGEIMEGSEELAAAIALQYEQAGASAISCLTDSEYFSGSFDYLRAVKKATNRVPILCKDFIVNEFQIFKAREAGADAVLLIVALLDLEKIQHFLKVAARLGMDCLVEVHDREELELALEAGAEIIGINNRNLKTFEVDLGVTRELSALIPEGKIVVTESGIKSAEDLKDLAVNAALVGTSLMKNHAKIEELLVK